MLAFGTAVLAADEAVAAVAFAKVALLPGGVEAMATAELAVTLLTVPDGALVAVVLPQAANSEAAAALTAHCARNWRRGMREELAEE